MGPGGLASPARLPGTKGANDTPQLPVTTVVTPWLDFGATAGCVRTMRSSWV